LHHTQPRQAQVEVKYRAYPVVKHSLADQLAHVERNHAVVFDGAFAFRLPKQTGWQPVARDQALPQRARLSG